jgi:lipid-A-disaccharide synthase
VSPSVWAWRRYRLRKIARAVDLMLTLFPFEEHVYQGSRTSTRCVGHPLAESLPQDPDPAPARRRLGLPVAGPVVALLPGSRLGEVGRLAGSMVGAAAWLRARRPQLGFVIPFATAISREAFETEHRERADTLGIRRVDDASVDAMAAADVVLVASGTATLEAMLMGRAMVVCYRTAALTWAAGRRMLHVDRVALPSLLAGRTLVPELLQEAATPQRLGAEVLALLEAPRERARLARVFGDLRASLARGADAAAAQAVLQLLGRTA